MNLHTAKILRSTITHSVLILTILFTHSLYAAQGYATRYWDGCKPHCSWQANSAGNPVKTCNLSNKMNPIGVEVASSCNGGDAYTCWDMSPKRISDTLSYGYAAVPATGAVCGKCFQLTFTGTGKYNEFEPGSMALKAKQKKLIVMATNIGHDVEGGQFDLLIPGGGVGAFNACSTQWQVSNEELGAQYGGFLSACQSEHGYNDTATLKGCVTNRCDAVFSKPGMEDLKSGCEWYVNWFEMADNPNLEYEEVACPAALVTGAYEDVSDDSGSDNSDSDNSGSDNSGSDNSGSDNSGSDNSGSDNSGSDNSGSDNSGSDNSGSDNSGSDNSGSDNSGSDNSGSDNSGSDNSGSDNSGSGNSGSDISDTNDSSSSSGGLLGFFDLLFLLVFVCIRKRIIKKVT